MDSPAPKPDGVGLMNTPDHYMYERRSVIATAKICMITHVWNNHVWARRTMDKWNSTRQSGTTLAGLIRSWFGEFYSSTYTKRIIGCPPCTHFDWKANSDVCECTHTCRHGEPSPWKVVQVTAERPRSHHKHCYIVCY